jgi:DNA adenine methylase
VNHGLIPYIGGKHRLAHRLVEFCHKTGGDTFVDVFGGSAAVMLAASSQFSKLIYNDLDGDLVNLFRVVADRQYRAELLRILRWLPPSRRIFDRDHEIYVAGGHSFGRIKDPVERARCSLYRHLFAFGGKVRNGGFQISAGEPGRIKEVQRYRNVLRKVVTVGEIFRGAIIENLDYQDVIRIHGQRKDAVLFVDPPYLGSERNYSRVFGSSDHVFLAHQLTAAPAHVVCTYYDSPAVRELYPADRWVWHSIKATKNCCLTRGNKVQTDEWVIVKRP